MNIQPLFDQLNKFSGILFSRNNCQLKEDFRYIFIQKLVDLHIHDTS